MIPDRVSEQRDPDPRISRRRLLQTSIVAGASLLALGQGEIALTQQPSIPLLAAPRYLFGIVGHAWWMDADLPTYMNLYRDLGASGIRIAADWKRFEPEEGRYNFSMYDNVFREIRGANMEITGNFVTVPRWASTNTPECGRSELLCDLPENRMPQLKAAIRAVVGRYPYIYKWEVGNEPELWPSQGNNPSDYLRVLRAFCEEAPKINPYVQIAAATATGWGHLEKLYNLAPDKPWDAVTFHPYPEHGGGSRLRQQDIASDDPGTGLRTAELDRIYAGMQSRNDGHKPVWVTEYGWEGDPSEQAQRYNKTISWFATRSYIKGVYLHMLHDTGNEERPKFYGVYGVARNGFVPKQPYYNAVKNYPRAIA